jgi:hypothetical protein
MRGGGTIQPGGIYHVISRFVAREWFIESSLERQVYLSMLGRALLETSWRCFSYAVMSSHVHFGFLAGNEPLVEWMRSAHTSFALWMNFRRERRIGGVFVRGPSVSQVRPDCSARLLHYIHDNPVRAGVVEHAADSDWTSHRAYVGSSSRPDWLDVKLGFELTNQTRKSFQAWFDCTNTTKRSEISSIEMNSPAPRGRPRISIG